MTSTKIKVRPETFELLRRLKVELRARSYDDALRRVLELRWGARESMFGAHPALRPMGHDAEFLGDRVIASG